MAERVRIEGVVGESEHPAFCRAILEGPHGTARVEHLRDVDVVTPDGRCVQASMIGVEMPVREIIGSWRDVRAHPTRPPGSYDLDAPMKLRGMWLVPGDRVCVIAEPIDDTRVDALVVGIGDDAAALVDAALATEPRAAPRVSIARAFATAAIVQALAGAALIAGQWFGLGTLGAGVSLWFAALSCTRESPAVALSSTLVAVTVAVLSIAVTDDVVQRNIVGASPVALVGIVPIWWVWRARPVKWALLAGLVALTAIATVIALRGLA